MNVDRSDWRLVRFGDVVTSVNENISRFPDERFDRVVGLEHMDGGTLHVERWDEDDTLSSFNKIFRKGQTLFAKRRAYQRKVGIADFDGICSGDILVFDTKHPDILFQSLIPFVCMSDSFYSYVESNSQGSLSPRVSFSALSKYEFLLPPIEEQKRIAKVLWAVDEVIVNYKGVLQNTKELEESYIKSKIETKASEFVLLGEIANIQRGKFSHRPRNLPQFYGGVYPFVQTGDIQNAGKKITKYTNRLTESGIKYSKNFPPDTLLITIAAIIGAVSFTSEETWVTDSVVAIQPMNETSYTKDFLWLFLRAKRKYLENIVSTKSAQKNINVKILSELKIPLFKRKVQDEIVSTVATINESQSNIYDSINSAQQMLNTAIYHYFGGAD